ncbi:MAG: gliding motility-associated C-terminal domain-containing protein, partial [Bacteroidota bacterium]
VMFHDCLGEVGKERQLFRFGPQNPRTGDGMGVLHTDLPQYGSYIYTQLTAPLVKDSLYLVSYYVNKTDSFDFVCSNCVDAYLFEDASILTDTVNIVESPVLVDPQIKNPRDRILRDTVNWIQICDTFRAAGGEQYIMFGNYADSSTSIFEPEPTAPVTVGGYYFIDDVCVRKLGPISAPRRQMLAVCELDLPLTLDARPDFEGYVWSSGDTTAQIEVVLPGLYTVSQDYGCGAIVDTFIVEIEEAGPPIDLGADRLNCESFVVQEVRLDAGPDQANYRWSTGDTTSAITVSAFGRYSVRAEYAVCPDRGDTLVLLGCPPRFDFVIDLPNVFTPNGDNLNDSWSGLYDNITFQSLVVFDRWGRRMFVTDAPDRGWDGTLGGVPVEVGIYYYRLSYLEPVTERPAQQVGTLTLLR